ncbi:MAG: HEAT repeat domain-containing protein, partial [Polyangiaceae bacterium]|nr:HEAT repeat domain-containing protein [Polyangiaceae bacterium]
AARLASEAQGEQRHARDRVRRCGRRAVDALVAVIEQGAGCAHGYPDPPLCEASRRAMENKHLDRARLLALDELAAIAPVRAVELITPNLPRSGRTVRALLRKYLARAARRPAGLQAIAARLEDPALHTLATVELLRSVVPQIRAIHPQAGAAFTRMTASENDLSLRYLLLQPAAALAEIGDGRGMAYVRDRLRNDSEPMVRTRAAELSRGIEPLQQALMQALEDESVRVRDAATRGLTGVPAASMLLVRRLQVDDWPMVRAAAARALATAESSSKVDDRLALALRDPSPTVRTWAATALGARGATRFGQTLRALADSPEEKVQVRIAAVRALGRMCDRGALELLTVVARRARDPYSPEAASGLGSASVAALGRIHPSDLRARLQPLLSGGNNALGRAAAETALAETDVCGAGAAQ